MHHPPDAGGRRGNRHRLIVQDAPFWTFGRVLIYVGACFMIGQFFLLAYGAMKMFHAIDDGVAAAEKEISKDVKIMNKSHLLDDLEKALEHAEREAVGSIHEIDFKKFAHKDLKTTGRRIDTRGHYRLKTKFPNVHTAPLNRTTRFNAAKSSSSSRRFEDEIALAPFPPLSREARALLAQYSHLEPSQRDDAFIDGLVEKRALRPEAADLLKRLQTVNVEARSGRRDRRSNHRHGVVVVHPMGQLCNRLLSITSGFAFSLLSGRALVVDDTDFYCKAQELFQDPGFDWTSGGAAHLDTSDLDMSSAVRLENPETGTWDMTEPLLCSNYSSLSSSSSSSSSAIRGGRVRFSTAKAVSIHTGQYLVPYMQRNPFYAQALESLFPASHGGLFRPLSLFLFRPLPSLLQQRDRFVRQHFGPDDFIVGLQVRAGGDFTGRQMSDADWRLYGDCGIAAAGAAGKDVKFFVATDTAQGRERAKHVLGADRVIFGPTEFLLSNNARGVQMALLDLLLLQQCDDRVTTAWSTFGYFAAGTSGLPPNMVVDSAQKDDGALLAELKQRLSEHKVPASRYMGVQHKSDKRRQCVRLPTQQPCFMHFENWGASGASCAQQQHEHQHSRRRAQQWLEEEMLGGRYC